MRNTQNNIQLHSPLFYAACATGGVLSCGSTHVLMTPIDLVKCRKQVNPTLYKSLFNAFTTIAAQGGMRGVWTGAVATAFGYSVQGACKFGFYEHFKHQYAEWAGEERAFSHRTALYLAASASAEMIADVALCPFEAIKVKMQTSLQPYAPTFRTAVSKMWASEGVAG